MTEISSKYDPTYPVSKMGFQVNEKIISKILGMCLKRTRTVYPINGSLSR